MTCLPEREIWRSSSSSASTPSRMNPPSRASAGGSSLMTRLDRVAYVGRDRRARRRRLRISGACSFAIAAAARGGWRRATAAGRPDRAARPSPSATRAVSRSRSCTALNVSRSLPRSVVRNAISSTASSRSRIARARPAGAAATRAAAAPPIAVVGAIDLIEQRALPGRPRSTSTTSRCASVVGSMSRQSAAPCSRDGAHVREVRLLRVAQVAHERLRPPQRPPARRSRPKPSRMRRAAARAAPARAVSSSKRQPSTFGHREPRDAIGISARDVAARRPRRSRAAAATQSRRAGPQRRRRRRIPPTANSPVERSSSADAEAEICAPPDEPTAGTPALWRRDSWRR